MSTSFIAASSDPGAETETEAPTAFVEGRVITINEDGQATVDYATNTGPVLQALSTVTVPREELSGARVVLAFLDRDRQRPVIMGVLRKSIVEETEHQDADDAVTRNPTASIDGKRVEIVAEREILLKCGKSTISLRHDGRIVVRGSKLWSRASEVNRIHGASVRIN